MSDIKFTLTPITKKPSRKFKKKSKYDLILDTFLHSAEDFSKLYIECKNYYSLNNQLKKRIDINNYSGSIDVNIINNDIYMETTNKYKEIKSEIFDSLLDEYDISEDTAKEIIGIISSSSSATIITNSKSEN